MEHTKEEIAVILKKAIKGEVDRFNFYQLLAEKSDDVQAKKILGKLCDDESRHKDILIELYKKYVSEELGELPEKGIDSLSEVIKKGTTIGKSTEVDLINFAIEAEIAATKYYKDNGDLIPDSKFKEEFAQLAQEEHDHYDMLIAEREAMSGNHHWFSYDNDSPMEH